MQQTSAILPSYASNSCYIGLSPVLRCDLVADSRGSCGRWETSRWNPESTSQGTCDLDSRAQNDCSWILGSFLRKSKNPYRPPQYYKVGNSDSYASHSSKETKSLANTACTAQEDIANLSEAQKSVDKFVDEKSQCKAPGSINAAITRQQEQLLESDAKAPIASINLKESEKRQLGKILEKEVSLPHTGFSGIKTRCLRGPCTGRTVNGKLYERISKTDELQPNEFFLESVLCNCGAFGTDGEGIRDSVFDCELELDDTEESKSPFDDFWSEILSVIHLEQESRDNYSADTVNIIKSEVPLLLPDEDGLILLNYQEGPKEPKIPNADTSTDLDFVEDEINLPDEDSLISVDNLLSLSKHCSEVTFAGRTDRLIPNFTADSTGHGEVAIIMRNLFHLGPYHVADYPDAAGVQLEAKKET
ncbi:hypothetical protein RND71_030200 [Anisodus tanguticus]|uniref:Uncharacterized protein n=1 Tax=Anisodus tanguticus TaxID=243964 RepID=A0AAE1V0V1_9SOLA|nr:hypothetical protein RND71_030200 [Anisodus tanguticus]